MSSSFDISKAKSADTITKLLIFGIIRHMNESNNVSSHIPELISFMVILFYMETDYFYKPGNDVKLSQDGLTTVRMKQDSFCTVYIVYIGYCCSMIYCDIPR